MKALAVWLSMLIANSPAAAQLDGEAEPTGVMKAFFQAIKAKNLDRAEALTAPVDEGRKATIRPYYQKMAGRSEPSLIAHHQLSRTAVVVIADKQAVGGPLDLDPAYLVHRDGKWLVLFKLTRFDRDYLPLSDEEKKEFQRLEVWYEQQKPVLRKLPDKS
jgi:sulfite reductase alpha subunit-like flavoprotein